MKRILIIIFSLIVLNINAAEFKENELKFGLQFNYNADSKNKDFYLPSVHYNMELESSQFFELYVDANTGFTIKGIDDYTNTFNFDVRTAMRLKLQSKFFIEVAPSFIMIKEDPSTNESTKFSLETALGYDSQERLIKLSSPWNYYKDGLAIFAAFSTDLYEKNNLKNNEKDMNFQARIDFATLNRGSKMMFNPYINFIRHLNKNNLIYQEYMELNIALFVARDLTESFNFTTDFNFNIVKENSNSETVSSFGFDLTLNYYPIPELHIFFKFSLESDLSSEESELESIINFGLVYKFDLK